MYRRTAHRGIAALALVLMLTLVGAQPAAAAARSPKGQFTSFWGAVLDAVPGAHAVVDTLAGWFHVTDQATSTPPDSSGSEKGWGIDPNGLQVFNPTPPAPTGSTQN